MYIKRVIIEGFKSYKEQVATDPFSPKVNCVVGANGSGKTNFFHAISFALSDDLVQNLRNEDRHTLLHEGAGHQVVSAFVETVFDNSDCRIPNEEKKEVSTESTNARAQMLDARENLKLLEKEFKLLTRSIQSLDKDKDLVEKRRKEALKTHAQIELDLTELEVKFSADFRAKQAAKKHMGSLKKEIQECRDELNKIMSLHQSKVIKEEEISKCIIDREKQLSILYKKQGWPTQFANKAAGDEWLQRAIEDLQRVLSSHMAQEKKLHDESEQLKDEDCDLDIYIKEWKAELERQEAQISRSQNDFNRLRSPQDKLQDKRKSLWKEGVLSAEIDRLKSELVRAQKSLDNATPGDIRRGLNSVNRIIKDRNIRGVFGPILELFDCDEKFYTAVEVTAGNSLFHVVVETDEISTKIIRILSSEKGGRATFVPLNQVKAPHIDYPHNPDVEPLPKKLNFRSEYVSAFKQVFGRTVICHNLDVATNFSRSNGLDCITLKGDQVSKKGGMIGGFYDNKHSKLKFVSIIKQS